MAILYECHREIDATFAVWSGITSGEEWLRVATKQFHDPEWPSGNRYLTDMRTAEIERELPSQFGDILELYKKRVPPNIRHAVVAPNGRASVDHYQERMLQEGFRAIVFGDVATACSWLQIDLAYAERVLHDLRQKLSAQHS